MGAYDSVTRKMQVQFDDTKKIATTGYYPRRTVKCRVELETPLAKLTERDVNAMLNADEGVSRAMEALDALPKNASPSGREPEEEKSDGPGRHSARLMRRLIEC